MPRLWQCFCTYPQEGVSRQLICYSAGGKLVCTRFSLIFFRGEESKSQRNSHSQEGLMCLDCGNNSAHTHRKGFLDSSYVIQQAANLAPPADDKTKMPIHCASTRVVEALASCVLLPVFCPAAESDLAAYPSVSKSSISTPTPSSKT